MRSVIDITVARLELIAGRSFPDATWHHHTLRRNVAARTTKSVTTILCRTIPGDALSGVALERLSLQLILLLLAGNLTSNFVTRCALQRIL